MRSAAAALMLTVLVASAVVIAHEITFKGTVVSADQKALRVSVVDEKTRKPSTMTFRHDKDTKILRGDTLVSFAEAKIQKAEKIAVTVDHDFDERYAFVVRLDQKK